MKEFDFETSPSTSIEQGQRLLALGLKPETADMTWHYMHSLEDYELRHTPFSSIMHLRDSANRNPVMGISGDDLFGKDKPAWSLHRLLRMIPDRVMVEIPSSDLRGGPTFVTCADLAMNNKGMSYRYEDCNDETICLHGCFDDVYTNAVSMIEWLIKEDRFYKDLLEG